MGIRADAFCRSRTLVRKNGSTDEYTIARSHSDRYEGGRSRDTRYADRGMQRSRPGLAHYEPSKEQRAAKAMPDWLLLYMWANTLIPGACVL